MKFTYLKEYKKFEVENLVKESAQMDGTDEFLKVCNDLNINDAMISNFYAYNEDKLVGYLNIFAPLGLVAEIFTIVHSQFRKQKVFTTLFDMAKEEMKKYHTSKIIMVCNKDSKSGEYCLKH